jgi:hypothetical protein
MSVEEGLVEANGLKGLLVNPYVLISVHHKDNLVSLSDPCLHLRQKMCGKKFPWASFDILGIEVILVLGIYCQSSSALAWMVRAYHPKCDIAVALVTCPRPSTQSQKISTRFNSLVDYIVYAPHRSSSPLYHVRVVLMPITRCSDVNGLKPA